MQSRLLSESLLPKTRLAVLAAAGLLALLAANPASAAEKIGVSMPNIKGPWFTPVLYGISDEAKKLGYDVTIQDAGGYANVDKQVSQFSNLVVQKVAAILIDPANPASFNGAAREAKAEKIPVIGAGSPIVASDVEADAAASSSHCNIGHELAKGAKILLPNGGTIAVLAGPAGAFWASDRLRCFKEDMAGGNIKIVAEQTSEQDPAIALSLASDFLQRFPQVDMLYGADDTYGVGAARAAQGAQKCGKVKVLFAVLGEAAEEMMRAGCADYVVAQQPVMIGRSAVQMMDALVKGKPLPVKKIEVPLVPVTMANLNSIDKTGMQAPKGWTP
ncbi:substrate-binding domain-containing protein [Bradyrhizobium sp. dw_411]|uniref:substrate-binding domain-containing protein n=1 Tax=Bradyrhizobium sp. dw_411 TaxID=2720082 RepID=UPI001BCE88E8|nr:substrate-binding domain-containing protein [Bradyrhizobium sp. dw_411]